MIHPCSHGLFIMRRCLWFDLTGRSLGALPSLKSTRGPWRPGSWMTHSSSRHQATRAPLSVHRSSRSRRPAPCPPFPKRHRSSCRAGSVLLPSGHGGRLSSSSSQAQRSRKCRKGAIHGCGTSSRLHVSLQLARQHTINQSSRQLPSQLRRRKGQLRLPISSPTEMLQWPAQARAQRFHAFILNRPLTPSGWDSRRRRKRLGWMPQLQWTGFHTHRWVCHPACCVRQQALAAAAILHAPCVSNIAAALYPEQGSQPAKDSSGLHRQPLPAPPAAAAVSAAARPASEAPAAGAAAAAGVQPANASNAAAAAGPPAPSAGPAAANATAAAPAMAQVAGGPAARQDSQAASGAGDEDAPPDKKTQRGVLRLLRRLSATSPANCPRLPHDLQAQPAVLQQQSPPAQPGADPEQQAVPQPRIASPSAAAAGHASVAALDLQAGQPGAAAGPGPAVGGSGATAASDSGKGAPSSPAISLGSSGE